MRRACIDTHALVWYLARPKRPGSVALRWLRDAGRGRAEILIPAIVPIELALLRQGGRDVAGVSHIEALLAAQPAFQLFPLDLEQAAEFVLLEAFDDPFDRLVVAAARRAEVPLITADHVIAQTALVETVWD